jgi:hypothetical protein
MGRGVDDSENEIRHPVSHPENSAQNQDRRHSNDESPPLGVVLVHVSHEYSLTGILIGEDELTVRFGFGTPIWANLS